MTTHIIPLGEPASVLSTGLPNDGSSLDFDSLDERMMAALANKTVSAEQQRQGFLAFHKNPSTDPAVLVQLANDMASYNITMGVISSVTKKVTSVVDQLVTK